MASTLPKNAKAATALLGPGLISCQVRVPVHHVVLVRAYLEACDGLGVLFCEHGGDVTLAAPEGRERELDAFVEDICAELGAERVDHASNENGEKKASGLR